MATTPPPASSRPRTPPTPLHGPKYDDYEPYSPRRSSRLRAKERIDQIMAASKAPFTNAPMLQPTPRKTLTRHDSDMSSQTISPPTSPVSPVRRGLSPVHTLFNNGMLPTPAKTPRTKKGIFSIDRPASPQDAMPSPRRSRTAKRFTLDDEPDNERIQVYTDTADRVPEVDDDADNPFVVRKSTRKAKVSSFSQRLSDVTSGKTQYGMDRDIDEAVNNDEGMVYVFRGRKIYRKFSDDNNSHEHSSADPLAEDNAVQRAGASARERITRSSLKPRLLFPPREPSPNPNDVDEEADTDIDEANMNMDIDPEVDSEDELANTTVFDSFPAVTPKKTQSYMPATPPTTARKLKLSGASCSFALTPDASPEGRKVGEKDDVVKRGARLFDDWARTKPGKGRSESSKRRRDEMDREEMMSPKRARSSMRGL